MHHRITALIFLLIFGMFTGYAQTNIEQEDLVTDRPDETEAPTLVSKGFFQVETGIFYKDEGDDALTEKTTGYNTTLLRYGFLDNLELRMGFDLLKRSQEINGTQITETNTSLEPLLLGVKIGIAEENGGFPEIGFIGHLHLPFTVAKDYRPESIGADFRFAFNHNFSKSNLSYNLGAEWLDDSTEANFIYTLAYGFDIGGNLGAYVELYGDLPEDASAAHHWDAGLAYLVKNNIQLDAYVGTGINNDQKLIAGCGISIRIPK